MPYTAFIELLGVLLFLLLSTGELITTILYYIRESKRPYDWENVRETDLLRHYSFALQMGKPFMAMFMALGSMVAALFVHDPRRYFTQDINGWWVSHDRYEEVFHFFVVFWVILALMGLVTGFLQSSVSKRTQMLGLVASAVTSLAVQAHIYWLMNSWAERLHDQVREILTAIIFP